MTDLVTKKKYNKIKDIFNKWYFGNINIINRKENTAKIKAPPYRLI